MRGTGGAVVAEDGVSCLCVCEISEDGVRFTLGRVKERRRGNVGNSTRVTHVRIDFGLAFCELYIGLVGDLVHGEFATADDLAGVAVTIFEIS